MKRTFNIIIALGIAITSLAQSAQWSVAPVYKSVEQLSTNLFRISGAEKVGVATSEGEILIDTIADAVTNLSEGYALAINKEKKKVRLLAVISENGKVKEISEELYSDDVPCFANGKLLAKNKKNKYGYLNQKGAFSLSEEAANEAKAISKNKGKATADSVAQAIAATPDGPMPFAVTERDVAKYGYKNGEYIVLPPQFVSAQPFIGDHAIAETETGVGVLKLTSKAFTCKQTTAVMDAGMESTVHTSSIPENKDAVLIMKCVDSTGMTFESEGKKKGSNMLFELSTFRERRTFTVIATDAKGSLVLWNSNYDNPEPKSQGKAKPAKPAKAKPKAKKKKK